MTTMRYRPETQRAMSRVEALACRAEMEVRANYCASVNADTRMPFHIRYQAAIAAEDCRDVIDQCDAYIRKFCQEG